MAINININMNKPTPRQLAEEFCNMSSDEQAVFFSQVGDIWHTRAVSFSLQAESIVASDELSSVGRIVLIAIGEEV